MNNTAAIKSMSPTLSVTYDSPINYVLSEMFFGTLFLIILYLILRYILAWITYYNNLDSRLGDSTWRFSYDYPVIGKRDISDLDDKAFVRLRRKRNKIILFMYSIVFVMFMASMSLLSQFLLFFFN